MIVVFGDTISWDTTLDGALAQVFGEPVGGEAPDPNGSGTGDPTLPSTVEQLLEQASVAFEQANAALRAGDLAEYQRLVEDAQGFIDQAFESASSRDGRGATGHPRLRWTRYTR